MNIFSTLTKLRTLSEKDKALIIKFFFFSIAALAVVGFFYIHNHTYAHSNSQYYVPASATDATGNSPVALSAGDITSLAINDANRYRNRANWTKNASSYDETKYIEFFINGSLSSDATIESVTVTNVWNRTNDLTAAKLEIWDGTGWTHTQTLTIPASTDVDSSEMFDISSYIRTPAQVNGLRIRFLAYVATNKNTRTNHNFLQVHVQSVVTPVINSIALAPLYPKTNDTVAATVDAIDSDGDPLTYHYQWKRNGSSAGTDSATLDLSQSGYGDKGDSITVSVTADDGHGGTTTLLSDTVTIDNTAPVIQDHSGTIDENGSFTEDLTGSDDDNDPLLYVVEQQPSHGQASFADSTVTYTPDPYWNGEDSFIFEADDGTEHSAHMTVTITVTPVNYPPVAIDQSASTLEHIPVTVTLPAHDPDFPDTDTLSYSIVDGPTNGTLGSIFDTNKVTYTPTDHFNGTDTFTFMVNDGTVDSGTATVTISVVAVNDAPQASDGTATTDEDMPVDVDLSGYDPKGEPLTFSIVASPYHGTLSSVTGNTVTYTPYQNYNGSDFFLFKVNDGTVDSNIASETITVNPVNDPPQLTDIHDVSVDEGSLFTLQLNASDAELSGGSLVFSLTSGPDGATVSPEGVFSWTPTEVQGPDAYPVTVEVSDGTDTDTATFTVTVAEVNAIPSADDSSHVVRFNTPLSFDLGASDVDEPANTLTFEIVDPPRHGTLAPITDMQVEYSPETGFQGDDWFTYRLFDGLLYSTLVRVDLDIGYDNQPEPPQPVEVHRASNMIAIHNPNPAEIPGFVPEQNQQQTPPVPTVPVCPPYLTDVLHRGDVGAMVIKLQNFLTHEGFFTYAPTGYFGSITMGAVKNFQQRYAPDILTPSGSAQPTGFVGKYTLNKINALSCVH